MHMAVLSAPPGPLPPVEAPPPSAVEITADERLWWDWVAVVVAVLGGVLGVIGAVFQEIVNSGGIFGVVVAAPLIEEAMKPAGVYLLLIKWPQALRSQLHTAVLTALGGLSFAV